VQKLLAGPDQVDGPAADQLGVADQHVRAGRQQIDQQLHPVDQGRRERLHAVHGMTLDDLVQHLDQFRMLLGQCLGPGPYSIGQQQLPAR
jgi:hypothetical protein